MTKENDEVGANETQETFVWLVWDDTDYYGPHLKGVYGSERGAKDAVEILRKEWPGFVYFVAQKAVL